MSYDRLGVLRLVLLFPLFISLVVVDDAGRWAALALYLSSLLIGPVGRVSDAAARSRGPTALDAAAFPLLTLTAIAGLAAGGGVLAGPVGAGVVIIGRDVIALAGRGGSARLRRPDLYLRSAIGVAFVLMIVPLAGLPTLLDPHRLGGWLFMVCAVAALVLLVEEFSPTTKTQE